MREINHYERQYSSERAFSIIAEEIEKLSLSVQYKSVGNEIKTFQCLITDNDKTFIGCGKGIGIQSKVSATYEAFEHYYCFRKLTDRNHSEIKFLSIAEVLNNHELIIDNNLLVDFLSNKTTKLPWLTYKSFTSEEIYHYPLFLAEPRYAEIAQFPEDTFDYSSHAWLASDSGTASGTSFAEAAIHAMNESIERDAISLFLVRAFMKGKSLHLISKNSLPTHLQQYIKNIEHETQDELAIIDISSEFNVPSFCVSFTKQKVLIQPKGFGTSLNKVYALERALLEALQPLHLRTKTLEKIERETVERFAAYPLLQQAAIADIGLAISKKQYIEKSFASIETCFAANLNLNDQLSYLVKACQSKDFYPYFAMIGQQDSKITCVKIIIPGLDNFYTVRAGKFILPSQRAIDFSRKD